MKHLFIALLLAVPMTASAQISVPVTVDTSKITTQVQVHSTFKDAAGVWWSVDGTLNVKPIPAPVVTGETPPPPTGSYPIAKGEAKFGDDPEFDGFAPPPSAEDLHAPALVGGLPGPSVSLSSWADNQLTLQGHGFGDVPGRLELDYWPAPFRSWTDGLITADAETRPFAYTIWTVDHLWETAMLPEG